MNAVDIIEYRMLPFINSGKSPLNISLHVSDQSSLSKLHWIDTQYGRINIKCSAFIPQGYSYLMENEGCKGRAMLWVTKRAEK